MQLMIKHGNRYRVATVNEIAETAATYARDAANAVKPALDSPAAVRQLATQLYTAQDAEAFSVLFLDCRHKLISADLMFRGTLDSAAVYPREVVKAALNHGAAAVILLHNHPSGGTEPSPADEVITGRLKDALSLVDVRVLDHVIVAAGATLSFAERGLL